MKLLHIQKVAAKARQDLKIAETKAAKTRLMAKAAKAVAEKSRSEYKRARKAAKQAKKLAFAAESQAQEQARIFAKAQKHLAKASKKMGVRKAVRKTKPIHVATKAAKPAIAKAAQSKPANLKGGAAPAPPVRPATESGAVPASAQSVPPAPSGVSN